MLGYDKIEPAPLVAPTPSPEWDGRRRLVRDLTRRLAGSHQGFETHAYTFLGRDSVVAVGLDPSSFVQLRNPVQDGVDLVRQNPIVSLFNQARGNLRENPEGMLFEIGKGYSPLAGDQPEEKTWLGVVMWGPHGEVADGPASLFGRVMSLANDIFSTARFVASDPCDGPLDSFPWAHPIRSKYWDVLDANVAAAGVVKPEIREMMGKGKTDIGWFLFDIDACLASFGDELVPFQPPSRYPATKIDVALALPNSVPYVDVEKSLVSAGGDFLESLSLFDVFEGAPLDPGVRSLAFRVSLRAFDRTLSEADEQGFLKKVAEIAEDFGGCIRS
ncbi:MAG TPA: hypothetical protein DDW23_00265 [Planctomycetes bacterium]|nr:hypothetical protein [Planctomycetota bacterium]